MRCSPLRQILSRPLLARTISSFILVTFLISCSNQPKTNEEKEKFVFAASQIPYDTLVENLRKKFKVTDFNMGYESEDNKYLIDNCDAGEWGASVFFTDKSTGRRTAVKAGRLFAFGKKDSTYLWYCRPGHMIHGVITEIRNPRALPPISKDKRFCGDWHRSHSLQVMLARAQRDINTMREYSTLEDTLFDVVGIFTKANKKYAIVSSAFGRQEKGTFLAQLDFDKKKFHVIDTIFNKNTFYGWQLVCTDLYAEEQYIPFSDWQRDGLFIVRKDSIYISYGDTLEFPADNI
jgi:hypothetical protein